MEDVPITTTPPTTPTPATAAPPASSAAYRFALAAADWAYNTRCERVVLLDLRGRSPVTEFFLIATGTSARQMRTVADELGELGKREGFSAWQTSGYDSARWIVIDFVHVVAHVFDPESRDFYDLELLWGDCPRIDWRAELGLPAETPRPITAFARDGAVPVQVETEEFEDATGDLEEETVEITESVSVVTVTTTDEEDEGEFPVAQPPKSKPRQTAARKVAARKAKPAPSKPKPAAAKKTVTKAPPKSAAKKKPVVKKPIAKRKPAAAKSASKKPAAKKPVAKPAKKTAKKKAK